MLLNNLKQFGILSKAFHWLSAMAVFFLFGLGYWMMELDYYSQWYQTAPHWHESVGILLAIFTLLRIVTKKVQQQPTPLPNHSKLELMQAKAAHYLLYLLMLTMFLTGYLIPTADDRAIEVFSWFAVPSMGELFSNQEDLAGSVHEFSAYTLVILAVVHGLAALKHHFIDKDDTLRRMTGGEMKGNTE